METSTSRPAFIPERWKDRQGAFYDFRAAWWYRAPDGEPQGVVARFDNHDGKQIIPFFKPDGRGGFKSGGPPGPVLFGADRLNERAAPAFVVEGEKCAAALHSLGLAAVSAQGGANKAANGDWPALAGVPVVYLLPDNDRPGDVYARAACQALARLNPAPPVKVVRLPGLPEGGDAVDWLAARVPGWNRLDPLPEVRRADLARKLLALVEHGEPPPVDWFDSDTPRPASAKRAAGRYVATDNGIVFVSEDARHGFQEKPLCNFFARIVAEVIKDDGQETDLLLTVDGRQNGTVLPGTSITYDVFVAMNWPSKKWGTSCAVEPGMGAKDQLRYAIQTLSHADPTRPVERRTVYTHTGWRCIDGAWRYLHGGGAIGGNGPAPDIEVDLDRLTQYSLPAPSLSDPERRAAAAASRAILDMAPIAVTLPLLACVYLAPLADTLKVDFVAWLEAASGSQKSSMAGVALAHWGSNFDRNTLTASWLDTANALETKLFVLKDALAVVDDFAPQPSARQQADLDATVARVVRSCGNRSGRARLRPELGLRPERNPRGLVVSTAEQWPDGESVNARLFGITVEKHTVYLAALSRSQAAAADGLLARCMADFVHDLAGDFEAEVRACRDSWRAYRTEALDSGLSGRVPEQVAFLQVGADLALSHFRRCGLLTEELTPLVNSFSTFMELGARQSARVKDAQPAERFRDALLDILSSGAAHVVPLEADGSAAHHSETLHGPCIGWRRGESELCLLKVPTLDAVNEALRRGGAGLSIQHGALFRQLRQRGWLMMGDLTKKETHNTTRHVAILGKKERVLVFDVRALKNT